MAVGCPVIISKNVNIYADIIAHNAGLIAEVEPSSISASLTKLRVDDDFRYEAGRCAKKLVELKYSMGSLKYKYQSMYEDAICSFNK